MMRSRIIVSLGDAMPSTTTPTHRTLNLLGLAAALLLSACQSGPPTTVHLTLHAAAGLNPDVAGVPNPVQTHVYMLREQETFTNTDYFQLADKERAVLGADLLGETTETMHPGEQRVLKLPVPAGTKSVGIAVSFRNIDQGTWRAVSVLKGNITADLGEQTVKVSEAK